jgi:hypothetical protein
VQRSDLGCRIHFAVGAAKHALAQFLERPVLDLPHTFLGDPKLLAELG